MFHAESVCRNDPARLSISALSAFCVEARQQIVGKIWKQPHRTDRKPAESKCQQRQPNPSRRQH